MAKTTIDHGTIQKWVEARGGHPAHVKATGGDGDPGILRIDFPGFSGEGKLEQLGWDQFFDSFERNGLAFIYQDRTRGGQQSRFNKLVSRETVGIEEKPSGGAAAGTTGEQDAIELLTSQHRMVERLFQQIEQQRPGSAEHRRLFDEVADALAVHTTIEEKVFYPGVKRGDTEDLLEHSVEEHLEVKRVLATMLETPPDKDTSAELEELAGLTEEHVIDEEHDLFPKVRKLIAREELRELARRMIALEAELRRGEPRAQIPDETEEAAPI